MTLWPFSKSKRRRGADYDGKFVALRGFAIGGLLLALLVAGVTLIVLGLA